jgi:RimJ/RimL family protein N-acetyltransferase
LQPRLLDYLEKIAKSPQVPPNPRRYVHRNRRTRARLRAGQPYWGKGYGREAVAAVIDYGFRTLGIRTIRAYTDPSNTASQKVLLHCGLVNVGEVELTKPTRHGARRAPLFRISQPEF